MSKKVKCRDAVDIGGWLFYIYFLYVIIILAIELADCIGYVFNIPQTNFLVRVVIGMVICLIVYLLRKFWKIDKRRINAEIIIGSFIILIIGLLKSVYPDNSYDTFNYHLTAQRPGFINYLIGDNFFAKGNFQVWGFRLGDRLFYFFRSLLGYRLGTLVNTFVLIIIFNQLYGMFALIQNKLRIVNERDDKNIFIKNILNNKAMWAMAITLLHDSLLMIGTYYVDILGIPFGLEIIRRIIISYENEESNGKIYYFACLNGFWLALKLTNIVFIVPSICIYMYINRKKISVKRLLISAVCVILPCSVYLIFNYVSTKNPVFPYYNTIFKSPFFSQIKNFKDERWGGSNIIEKLLWLLYAIFKPEYRQSEIYSNYNFLPFLGIIGTAFFIIEGFYNIIKGKKVNIIFVISILMIGCSILWSFTTGYSRYNIFTAILLGIIAYGLFLKLTAAKKNNILTVFLCSSMCIVGVHSVLTIQKFYEGRGWSWSKWGKDTFVEELQKVFIKQELDYRNDVDMFYITDTFYNGMAEFINPKAYMYNASYKIWTDGDAALQEKELFKHKNLLDGNVVDIRKNLVDIESYITKINEFGMRIKNFDNYSGIMGNIILIGLEAGNEENIIYNSDENINIPLNNSGFGDQLTFISGVSSNNSPSNFVVKGYFVYDNEEREIFSKIINNRILNYSVDVKDFDKQGYIKLKFYNEDETELSEDFADNLFIINPKIN